MGWKSPKMSYVHLQIIMIDEWVNSAALSSNRSISSKSPKVSHVEIFIHSFLLECVW